MCICWVFHLMVTVGLQLFRLFQHMDPVYFLLDVYLINCLFKMSYCNGIVNNFFIPSALLLV